MPPVYWLTPTCVHIYVQRRLASHVESFLTHEDHELIAQASGHAFDDLIGDLLEEDNACLLSDVLSTERSVSRARLTKTHSLAICFEEATLPLLRYLCTTCSGNSLLVCC